MSWVDDKAKKELARIEKARRKQVYPYFREFETGGLHTTIDGKPIVNFSSNDYLGLTNHPKVKEAAKQAVDKYDSTYKEQLQRLEGSADWGELKPEQQKALLSRVGLRPPEKQSTGSDQDLLNALNNCGLDQWNTRTQALSQQASNALLEASRLLEPEVQSVHLSSGTLKDEKEVKAWLKDKEAELLAKVKKGPIVIQ